MAGPDCSLLARLGIVTDLSNPEHDGAVAMVMQQKAGPVF